MSGPMALPPLLASNPRLSLWVAFDRPGEVRVATGRVEIGQGVLTAMRQIAAEELEVALDRIRLQSGDTDLTPNEGYTAGSQSIQFGGVALRQACAEVRDLFLDHAAASFGYERGDLAVMDGAILERGRPTGHDYWSLAGAVDLARPARGDRGPKARSDGKIVGRSAPRIDLAGKVFGEPVFVHDMALDGLRHARIVRQPRRGATIRSLDEAGLRRAAKGPIDIARRGNFLAIVGDDESVVEAAAAVAANYVEWDGVEPLNPLQEEARWLLQQPSLDRVVAIHPQPRRFRRETATKRPIRACMWLTHRWRRPAALPFTVTVGSTCGPTPRACFRCARRLPACSRSTRPRSGSGMCKGRVATVTTAPTMPPPTPRRWRCRCRAFRCGCGGGARRNSASSR